MELKDRDTSRNCKYQILLILNGIERRGYCRFRIAQYPSYG